MTARLAIEGDIPTLLKLLEAMGQVWSEGAVREALADPWITVVRETGGVIDGFCFCRTQDCEGLNQAILGPLDGPHDSHQAWLRCVCEMGVAIGVEGQRRRPSMDAANRWIVFKVWPSIGPIRTSFETAFAFKRRRSKTSEGYEEMADGARFYFIKRPNLIGRAAQILEA